MNYTRKWRQWQRWRERKKCFNYDSLIVWMKWTGGAFSCVVNLFDLEVKLKIGDTITNFHLHLIFFLQNTTANWSMRAIRTIRRLPCMMVVKLNPFQTPHRTKPNIARKIERKKKQIFECLPFICFLVSNCMNWTFRNCILFIDSISTESFSVWLRFVKIRKCIFYKFPS